MRSSSSIENLTLCTLILLLTYRQTSHKTTHSWAVVSRLACPLAATTKVSTTLLEGSVMGCLHDKANIKQAWN